jgi:hypothetical protein
VPAHPTIKRLLRRTTRVVLISLAALMIYFSQYFTLYWLAGDGMLWPRPFHFVRTTIFYPIEWFASSSAPTSPYIRATAEWCYTHGNGKEVPWNELFDYWDGARKGHPIPRPQPRAAPTAAG